LRIALVHSDFIEYEPKKKALKSAEEIKKELKRIEDCLVILTSVEKGDEDDFEGIADQGVAEIEAVAEQLGTKNVVLYPWVHLSDDPSRPDVGLRVIKAMEKTLLSKDYTVTRAPFGWYKAFDLKCKGHPLSELSRRITTEDVTSEAKKETASTIVESEALKAEEETKHEFFIMTPDGIMTPIKDYKFKKKEVNLKKFAKYETDKKRYSDIAPPHSKLMRKLALVDYEPASDAGNFRWYPKGWIMKYLMEEFVKNKTIEYGAMPVETPIMYGYTHPAIEKYMHRFPARQYVIKSGTDNYFLRFAACFGQFLITADSQISYHNLPLKLFEMTHYSFRREQTGELSALRRLRTFTMPDMHTMASEIEMAKKCFKEQFHLSIETLAAFDFDYESVFRAQKDFFEENKEWFQEMVAERKRPALIETFDKRYAYFICKFEFNIVDNQNKASALSTVQIDVENSERFDITYVDQNNEPQRPYLLHTSISGAIERLVYALLEKAYTDQKQGRIPQLPLWVSPTQVRILPINEDCLSYCQKLANKLSKAQIRVDIDDTSERIGKKIRTAEKEWLPYIIVIGEREIESETLSVRIRSEQRKEKKMTMKELIKRLEKETEGMPYVSLTLPRLLSNRPVFSQYHE
jgi:threonyl-tRNA synthetase